MAIIDVEIPSSQTATTTINAGPGDVINIPAGMMGSITINGGPDVTINILGDPDPGSTFGTLTLGGWGSDIEPTVNIPAGVDFSRYPIDSNGENLTLNVGDGATLSSIDATGMSNTGTFTINAGNDVTIDGSINNYGSDAVFDFGSGATITGTTTATSVGDADVTFGDNATFGGTVALSGGNTANVNATFGDGLDLNGQLTATNGGSEMNIAIGNDATISNALNLTGQAPTNLTIGDNVTLLGNINMASSDDTVVIGDNWDLANVNMNLGDDNITLGMQAAGENGPTVIDGGNPNGADVDGITITPRPDQVQSFIDAGYIDNGDGTYSAPPAAFNGSPLNGAGSVPGGLQVIDFEGAAAPLPNDPPVIDPIADTTTPENSTDPVFTASATDPNGDPVTYSLSGDDAALFNIDPTTGEVTPIAGLDFENPTDANGDGVYDITVVATDPDGATAEEPVAITVGDVNEAPVLDPITDPTIPENSTDPVFTASATDPDGDQPVYSLTGDDAALFNIDPATGEVTPIAPLDFENPTDANGDGVYDITVVATDPNDPTLFDEEPVAITVGDVNETSTIVDGENFAELMTPGYSDGNTPTDSGGDIIDGADGDNDTILGNGGDDTINAGLGTDEVYGGSGNDVIDGGAGNDTITGDFADGVSDVVVDSGTQAGDDSLSGGAGDDVIYGDSGDGNGVTTPADTTNTSTGVDYQVIYLDWFGTDLDPTETGGTFSSFSENGNLINGATYGSSGNPLSANIVTMFAGTGNGDGQYDGDNTVSNETFTISNNPGTTFTFDGSAVYNNTIVTYEDGTTATVSAVVFQSTSGDLFLAPEFSNNADTSVYTAQPITSIQLGTQDTSAGLGNGLSLERILDSWVAFSEQTSPSDGGNDTITGGEGADTMYGEGGDDTFLVGSAAEGAGDVITGGNGPDENTDNDILDLRGAGNVTINQSADVNDAGATTGTVTFSDGSTLQFSQIEQILTDPPNSAPVLDPIGAQSFDENDTGAVFTASATDPDSDPITYSLTGPDAALFNIDPTTGEVTPVNPLDFENPTDAGGDNVYNITVVATDPSGLSDQEDVAITVADLNEPDGVVDGEDTGETMDVGYNDNNAPTDGGGDVITTGDDSIAGNGGDDTIDAGAGNDTIDGGADDDSITGGDGDDSVLGGDGADTLAGGEGEDTLDGGAGDDDIAVGGDDSGIGGSGDDVFTIDPTDPATNIDVTIDGGTDGTVPGEEAGPENGDEGDVLDLSDETGDLDVVLEADPESGTVDGIDTIAGDDDITFDEIEKVLTGTGDDSIDGGSSTGPIDVETGGGDDTVAGGTGDDTIDGGDDNDSIDGGDGDDSIAGGAGTDTLTGGLGADTIDGGAGDDDITVGAGDVATGGSGDDDFFLDPTNTDGPDTITIDGGTDGTSGAPDDFANGDDGDTLNFTGLTNVTIVTPLVDDGTGSFSGVVSYENDEGETVTVDFTEIENVLGLPGGPDGVVDGEATGELMDVGYDDANAPTDGGGDLITENPDSIEGNGGDDTINAGGGNDTVDGGADDDVIDGGLGDDSVLGGDGADSVVGGDGADTIYGGSNVPADNLIDDNIDPGQNDPDTLNGQDTLDGGAGNDVIFGEDDDDSITGGTGNDSLDGGIDDDILSGGDGEDTLIGGQGADSMSGGLGDDTFLVGTFDDPNNPSDSYIEGIGDTIVGGEDPGDTDTDTLDLTGSGPLTVIPSAPGAEDGIVNFYSDPAKTNLIGTLAYSEIENIIPCFTPGTLIATMKGEVPVESLQEGDKVITRDNGIQEIRWIGKRTLQRDELRRAPHLSPILIKAGSLGDGLPERDMMVSPQHRMLVAGDQTQLYFEEPEVLVAAKHLINNGSIQAIDTLRATYIHFMFDQHEVVLADGAWTESFQPGDQTLGAMGTAQRNEILELFPDLEMQTGRDDYVAARRVLKGYEAKLLKG